MEADVRFINLYLVGYVVFVVGVLLALWRADVLSRMGPMWVGIGLVIAIGIGIMFAVTAGKPTITRESRY
jgi:hypothetical protein